MKFYNPFKWHLVKINANKFAWRRWYFSWEYLSAYNEDITWSAAVNVLCYCTVDTIEEANRVMQKHLAWKEPKKLPFEVKVL